MPHRIPALLALALCFAPAARADWTGAQTFRVSNGTTTDLNLTLNSSGSRVGVLAPAAAGAAQTIVEVGTDSRTQDVPFPAGHTWSILIAPSALETVSAADFDIRVGDYSGDSLGSLTLHADFAQPSRSHAATYCPGAFPALTQRYVDSTWRLERRARAQEAKQSVGAPAVSAPLPTESKQTETKTWQPAPDEGGAKGPAREAKD